MRQEPLYIQVSNRLRQEIFTGQWPPGAQLPTEPDLEKRYEDTIGYVSRVTVRKAMSQLAAEGLVVTTSGRGTFVRSSAKFTYYASRSEASERRAASRSDAYMTDVQEAGRTPSQTFESQLVVAPDWVANQLGIEEGSTCVLRRCWRRIDGQPWSLQDSYYPRELTAKVPELESPHDIERGTTRVLQEVGIEQVGFTDELTSRMPTPDEARWFITATGVPVIVQVRTAYTSAEPVRVTATIFPADRNQIVYELGDLTALYEDGEDGSG